MNSTPFLRFGVLVVKLKRFCMLLFYSLLGELWIRKAFQFQLFQLFFEGCRSPLFII